MSTNTTDETAYKMRWIILLTVIVGTFLGRLDQTIVNLALPNIINDFGITVTSAGWIATAYILANAVFVPIWGKLGDTIGRKLVYIIGFVIFIIGSVLAGLSWNLSSMIVFRIIQAIASSADYPTAMAILAVTFPQGQERTQALGIWSASFAAASVFGPLLGGPLIDNFGWRSVFLINLPIGLIGLYMASRYINESRSGIKNVKFDWWGATTLGAALFSLVLVLDKGLDWGWISVSSLACYALITIFTFVFIAIEHRHPEPIVDLKFFKNSVFVHTIINNFVIFMGLIGSIFLIPIFAQTFLGYDATQTGFLFIPMAFGLVIAAAVGGSKFMDKINPTTIIIVSTLMTGVGLYLFSFIDARSSAWAIIIPLIIMAMSMGLGMPQRTSIVAAIVPQSEIGMASSVLALARNIAGAFGIAIFGTILQNTTNSNVLAISRFSVLNSHVPQVVKEYVGLIILKAQVNSYGTVFVISSIIVLVSAFFAIKIKVPRSAYSGKKEEIFVME